MSTHKYPAFRIVLIFLVSALIFSSCQKDSPSIENDLNSSEFSQDIPLAWNQLYLEIERFTPGYKPPVSARNYGYISLIAYEAIVNGSGGIYNSLSNQYTELDLTKPEPGQVYNWEVVLNSAYERAFELYFPTAPSEQQFKMLEIAGDLRKELQEETEFEVYERSSNYGKYIAEEIYNWSSIDSWGHEGYLSNLDPLYIPPAQSGYWQPTYPDFGQALLPHWGKVRTFAAGESEKSAPPPAYSTAPTSQLYKEAELTKDLVDKIKAGEEEEEYWIAEFWSDDCPILTFSPAGRWVSITNQVVEIETLNMMDAVAAYAQVGTALADAGIKCWQEKYKYNMLRPIDYIRAHLDDPEWNTIMCPDGSGGFFTPNFPTYPSGHATFGGAASYVLTRLFGTTYNFTDRSHEGRTEFRGTPRSFTSFYEMADENAYSRVPLGVHFTSDSDAGVALGKKVGRMVNRLPWK